MTRSDLLDRLKGLLGGRGRRSCFPGGEHGGGKRPRTGYRHRPADGRGYGMSEKVGLIHCGHRTQGLMNPFLPNGDARLDCSEALADQIDREVKQLLDSAYSEAKNILLAHRELLEVVAKALVERETLNKPEFLALIGRDVPDRAAEGGGRVSAGEPAYGRRHEDTDGRHDLLLCCFTVARTRALPWDRT